MAQILFNFLSPIRSIAVYIDSIVFGLIADCFEIIMGFANSEFYKLDIIDDIRKKIYFVITLIAMFRLAFLLINSLINPDKLTDQNEGLSKIAFNFVIMLVLLVITPMLFNEALDIQETVVTNNLITGIFSDAPVGSTSTASNYKDLAKDSSRKMRDLVIGSLIYPDPAIADFKEADKKYEPKNNCSGKCKTAVEAYNKMLDQSGEGMKYPILSKYIGVTEKVDDEEIFVYNYQMFLTLICGGFIVYILLTFSFDLAKRFIELNLLMVLSPLFIATYIDPKSVKSGPFNNWLKAVGKSYVGLFLRLGALAVMLLFIKIISSEELDTSSLGWAGKIILLFAVLTFCKNIPKWLGDLLGTGDAMSGVGLGKKIEDTPFVGKGLMGAARKAGHMASGAAVGAAAGALKGGYNTLKDRSKRRGEAGLGYFRNGQNKNDPNDRRSLSERRREAYARDKNPEHGGFFKQMGAGMLGSGLAGGRAGVKADNIKGAFQGSVKAADNFGKTVGNKGGTIKGWVDEKLDNANSSITLMYGSPDALLKQRDSEEKNAKARLIAGSGAHGETYDDNGYLTKGSVATGVKAQQHIQRNMAGLATDPAGNAIDFKTLDPQNTLKMTKAYQAAVINYGEDAIGSVTFDQATGNIKIGAKVDPSTGTPKFATITHTGADMDVAGYTYGAFVPDNKSAKEFNSAYYGGQQAALQNFEQFAGAASKLKDSINSLDSVISGMGRDIRSAADGLSSIPSDIKTGITSSLSAAQFTATIERGLAHPGLSDTDRAILEDMKNHAERMAEKETERTKADQERITYETEKDKVAFVYDMIDGGTIETKKFNVEKAHKEADKFVLDFDKDK